ncbi:D-glycero-beta-D-manno-heptose 1,7-bisphosphate 7-phosphatase [Thiomicrospira microaerophila]|uniref:D-glycero-beta-D-manno-heptose 1,7-bisphosphate 7-phosphatase n=1 Tax=Thiomicrospira microaerophila TaxID=406020 RepID=UPI0020102322|nr:D-glycero-beta-D-manno-heptose 1,7-bisphosphate 7-phosphatase [Thiomicrospira microaerophila]UQB42906.1 D-glycero-beta-D-manno-heptose 1,7-bisphosphate 7-phosphatase [Thiomicrospira microaerophila]
MTHKIVVLDRDGVINQDSDAFIKSADEWQPIAGSLEAIARLNEAGWLVAVATNQSGIKRGYYDRANLSQMHQKMQSLLASVGGRVDWLNYSPYLADCGSVCRKPLDGMLRAIELRYGQGLKGMPMVGDSLTDIQAAQQAGLVPYLVKTGKGERTLASQATCLSGVPVYENLAAWVEEWLA